MRLPEAYGGGIRYGIREGFGTDGGGIRYEGGEIRTTIHREEGERTDFSPFHPKREIDISALPD